jgi:hypothetical protein
MSSHNHIYLIRFFWLKKTRLSGPAAASCDMGVGSLAPSVKRRLVGRPGPSIGTRRCSQIPKDPPGGPAASYADRSSTRDSHLPATSLRACRVSCRPCQRCLLVALCPPLPVLPPMLSLRSTGRNFSYGRSDRPSATCVLVYFSQFFFHLPFPFLLSRVPHFLPFPPPDLQRRRREAA